jgi:O-antigen ligase
LIALNKDGKFYKHLELSIPIFIGIFIFIIPFPHKTATQETCFYLSVFLTLTLVFYKKIDFSFNSPLTLPIVLFTIWTIVGLFTALNKENTLHDIYSHLIKYIVIFYLVANFFNDKKRFIILTWILITSASILSIGGIIYFYIIKGHELSTRFGLPEVGIGVNYIGYFSIVAIFFSLINLSRGTTKMPLKITSVVCMITSSLAAILTGTIGTIFGLILPSVILLPRYKKNITVYTLILMFIIGLIPIKHILTPEDLRTKLRGEERTGIWYTYYKIIEGYPITGIGYGMQTYNKHLLEQYNPENSSQIKMKNFHAPHNTFIDVTTRLGFVGFSLFLYILFIFGRMGWQLIIRYTRDDFIKTWALCLTVVFTSFLIQGMFTDLLLGVQIIIFFILMAMMTVLWRLNKQMEDNG